MRNFNDAFIKPPLKSAMDEKSHPMGNNECNLYLFTHGSIAVNLSK